MLQHAGRVIKTDGWSHLLQTCPDMANRIIASLSKFRDDHLEEANRGGFGSGFSGSGRWRRNNGDDGPRCVFLVT